MTVIQLGLWYDVWMDSEPIADLGGSIKSSEVKPLEVPCHVFEEEGRALTLQKTVGQS